VCTVHPRNVAPAHCKGRSRLASLDRRRPCRHGRICFGVAGCSADRNLSSAIARVAYQKLWPGGVAAIRRDKRLHSEQREVSSGCVRASKRTPGSTRDKPGCFLSQAPGGHENREPLNWAGVPHRSPTKALSPAGPAAVAPGRAEVYRRSSSRSHKELDAAQPNAARTSPRRR